jgi:hypothetical protein
MDSSPPPTFLQRVQSRLAASRFFTFSLLLHIVIVLMAGSVVIVHNMAAPPDFAAEGVDGLVMEESAALPPPPQQVQLQQQQFTPATPQVTTPAVDMITTMVASPTSFQVAAPVPQIKAPASTDINKTMQQVAAAAGTGMSKLPSVMAGRAGGMQRTVAMQKMGGKEKSEKAVLAGLRWLQKTQNENGSWSKQFTPSMTGLALLCFLGHGETQTSQEFGPTVKKAVDWILTKGIEFQGRLHMQKTFTQSGVYEHAIVAYALGEYFTMTKDERVKDVFIQAMTHIVQGQAPDGGWQYAFAKGPDSDTSVSGWQIQALKAAHLSGLNIPGVDESLDKAMLNLKRVQGPNGGFGYRTPGDSYGLAGVGVLCTYFWKGEKDKLVRDGIKFILDKSEKDYPVVYKHEKANLYGWYYHTQACLMFGGAAWTKWNKWFQDQIVDAQSPDGSWPPTGNPKPHGPEDKPDNTGQTYRTTLCVLMLEVFYRYMPTTK